MKKEIFASILTITSGLATNMTFPTQALATTPRISLNRYSKFINLKSTFQARHTEKDGRIVMGHIYFNLEQTTASPEFTNQIVGEMMGSLYFESDDFTHEYNGKQYKTKINLAGDDGEVLLDLANKDEFANTYEIYGCNSTRTSCTAEGYSITFAQKKQISMGLKISAHMNIQLLETFHEPVWTTEVYSMPMVQVKN
jgi:hypothetical protein